MAIKLVGVAGEMLQAERGSRPRTSCWPTTRSSSSATSPITSRSRRPCSRPGDRWLAARVHAPGARLAAPALEGLGRPWPRSPTARSDPVLEPDPTASAGWRSGTPPAGPVARAAPPPSRSKDKLREALSSHLRPGRPASTSWSRSRPTRSRCPSRTRPSAGTRRRPRIARSPRSGSRRRSSTPRSRPGANLSFTPWHALPEHRPLGRSTGLVEVDHEALSRRGRH